MAILGGIGKVYFSFNYENENAYKNALEGPFLPATGKSVSRKIISKNN